LAYSLWMIASVATSPSWEKRNPWRPFHDIRIVGGRFNNFFKIPCLTDTFWSLLWVYGHHRKIMPYNMVKNYIIWLPRPYHLHGTDLRHLRREKLRREYGVLPSDLCLLESWVWSWLLWWCSSTTTQACVQTPPCILMVSCCCKLASGEF